ncbi:MAG: hypothetical protein EON58_03995 [Alphaproteobacteria bacterium]|nr:MAG: hypothetical protein EON58_03995 [Alphaproteobacteria bacterium]
MSEPPAPPSANSNGCAGCLWSILLIAGIALTGIALTMETGVMGPVGEVRNLSGAHDQSDVLAIGLAMAGVAALSLVIRSGPKP